MCVHWEFGNCGEHRAEGNGILSVRVQSCVLLAKRPDLSGPACTSNMGTDFLAECVRLKCHWAFKLCAKLLSAAAVQRPSTKLSLASLRPNSSLERIHRAMFLQMHRAQGTK